MNLIPPNPPRRTVDLFSIGVTCAAFALAVWVIAFVRGSMAPGPQVSSRPAPAVHDAAHPLLPAEAASSLEGDVVYGRLLHAGRPVPEFTSDGVTIGPFRDERTGQLFKPEPRIKYDRMTGEFRFFGLPEGEYGVYISAGPFWHNFRHFKVVHRSPTPVDFHLTRRIYLRSPVDTSKDVLPEALSRHPLPVAFEWDPVPGAVAYSIRLRRRRLADPKSDWVLWPLPPVTDCRLDLDFEENFEYEFAISAHGNGHLLATLSVYQAGLGSRYRFRIGNPVAEMEEPGK